MITLGLVLVICTLIYHFVMGGLGVISVNMTRKLLFFLYAVKIPDELDPKYEYTWKLIGAFAGFVCIICILVVRDYWLESDPRLLKELNIALSGLFVLRALMRLIYRDLFKKGFGVSLNRSLINVLFNLAIGFLALYIGLFA